MNREQATELFPAAAVYTNPAVLAAYHRTQGAGVMDSKTFVDLPLKASPRDVLMAFDAASGAPEDERDERFARFFQTHFGTEPDGAYAEVAGKPRDYSEAPPEYTRQVGADGELLVKKDAAQFSADVKKIWLSLFRVPVASDNESWSSLIPLHRPFFIAGGRFRECYYWDSYWIVKGLLASDMPDSARDVVDNMLDLVDRIGFMPNANRVYFLNRSQPPFLTLAVAEIFMRSKRRAEDVSWLKRALPLLDREYANFVKTHVPRRPVPTSKNRLAVYRVDVSDIPRPESWRVDVLAAERWLSAQGSPGNKMDGAVFPPARELYQHLAAGAASGWDYSSRWSPSMNGDGRIGLEMMRTSDIVPACVNSILLKTERTLSRLHELVDAPVEVQEAYSRAASEREECINQLLWNDQLDIWCDFNVELGKSTEVVAASGLMPLWAEGWPSDWTAEDARRFIETLSQSRLVQPGGLATTVNTTGQQWDFPNCWPPLVEMAVTGLENLHRAFPECGALALSRKIAGSMLRSMFLGFRDSRFMHEKYDASVEDGRRGEGGEYDPQVGFGWSNGVALNLMERGYWF